MASATATSADAWRFLLPWFDRLPLVPHDANAVGDARVSGDASDHDFWLGVALEREDVLLPHADGEAAALRQLREALVLTHLMATVEYDLWFEWFFTDERCYLAPWFIQNVHRVPLRYAFVFDQLEHIDQAFLAFEGSMDNLMGATNASDEFVRDLARVQDLLARHGVEWNTLEPIPILFRYDAQRTHPSLMVLQQLKNLVEKTRQVEEVVEDETRRFEHPGRAVLFRVTALEADLSAVTLTSPLFHALASLVALGVDVTYLSLPVLPASAEDAGNLVQIDQVGKFMRSLLGLSVNTDGHATRVRHLAMPSRYLETFWCTPFCSALASAQHVRVLHLWHPDDLTDTLEWNEPKRRHVWSWLAFALFSSASTRSVEALVLDGLELRASDVQVIREIIDSDDPLSVLCERAHRTSYGADNSAERIIEHTTHQARPVADVHLKGFWDVRDGQFRNLLIDTRPGTTTAEVMHVQDDETDDSDGKYTVFIPGYGFCSNDNQQSQHLSNKKRRVEASESQVAGSFLHTFVLESTEEAVPALHAFLQLLGPRLRNLHLKIADLNDGAVGQVFASCPQLEHFAITGARLATMGVFTDAYERHNLPLSSLTLDGLSVPEYQFQAFLRRLLQHNKIESTLRHLEFGGHWPYELSSATLAIFRNILDHNKTLTHIKVQVSAAQCPRVRELVDSYHGQLVEGLSYTERLRRLAFLGTLKHGNSRLHDMTDDMKRLVMDYGAPLPIRRVATWSTTTIGGLPHTLF